MQYVELKKAAIRKTLCKRRAEAVYTYSNDYMSLNFPLVDEFRIRQVSSSSSQNAPPRLHSQRPSMTHGCVALNYLTPLRPYPSRHRRISSTLDLYPSLCVSGLRLLHQDEAARSKAAWLTQEGFVWPVPKAPSELNVHPQKPSEQRINDLKEVSSRHSLDRQQAVQGGQLRQARSRTA